MSLVQSLGSLLQPCCKAEMLGHQTDAAKAEDKARWPGLSGEGDDQLARRPLQNIPYIITYNIIQYNILHIFLHINMIHVCIYIDIYMYVYIM